MTRRGITVLGIGQCVNWGVIYYAFAVLVLPVERDLGVATWVVTGAFSLALLMSAALAPTIGRLGDRGRAPLVMQIGGFAAASLLIIWALTPTLLTLYLVWTGLGLCMAATLYEPAFVIVGRAYEDSRTRLRALAAVTLFGGLASTIFLPFTALLVRMTNWRVAVVVLAAVLIVTTCVTTATVLRRVPMPSRRSSTVRSGPVPPRGRPDAPRFSFIATMFSLVTLASAAFTTNLLPALGQRGIAPTTAALLGSLIGVMQLPGRALLMGGLLSGSPQGLLALSLLLQAGGLGLIAFTRSVGGVAGGTTLFALGAGLATLVRPLLIQAMFGLERGGYLNGRIARHQQLARAAGPIAVAWLASMVGYVIVFTVMAVAFMAAGIASHELLRSNQNLEIERETV